MTNLKQVIGSGIKRVLTQPYCLGDENKIRQPGSHITIAPHYNPKTRDWVVGGYWHMCDAGVVNLLAISEPLSHETELTTP